MTVEEFKSVYPDIVLKKLITAGLDALNRIKHMNLSYDHHITELVPKDKPFCQVVIYYKNETTGKIGEYKTGEYLYTQEDMGNFDKIKKINPDLAHYQKIILRVAYLIYEQEKRAR